MRVKSPRANQVTSSGRIAPGLGRVWTGPVKVCPSWEKQNENLESRSMLLRPSLAMCRSQDTGPAFSLGPWSAAMGLPWVCHGCAMGTAVASETTEDESETLRHTAGHRPSNPEEPPFASSVHKLHLSSLEDLRRRKHRPPIRFASSYHGTLAPGLLVPPLREKPRRVRSGPMMNASIHAYSSNYHDTLPLCFSPSPFF